MLPERQRTAFPTVANIRKGTPRFKTTEGKERMGKDLKNKFRVEFLPGTGGIRETFHKIHPDSYVKYPSNFLTPDGFELTYLQARIPTKSVWDGWEWYNETYNAAGMLIARADGDQYITRKDPLTMEKVVEHGQPYEKFNPGDVIQYERDGKTYQLKMKSMGRLLLFLPELGEFVSFELRTTSYIDCLLIDQNLRAIQGVADFLNNGVAGGIPLDIYRVEMDSPWHKDGVSRKGKQWFIQIKANEAWAKAAIQRMSSYALNGESTAGLLNPPTITIPDLPTHAYEESDDDDEGVSPEEVVSGLVQPESMTIKEARETIVIVNGHEKFMSELTPDRLNYIVENNTKPHLIEAAKFVLEHDHNMVAA